MFRKIRVILGLIITAVGYGYLFQMFSAWNENIIEMFVNYYLIASFVMLLGGFVGLGIRGYDSDLPLGLWLFNILLTPFVTLYFIYVMIRELFDFG